MKVKNPNVFLILLLAMSIPLSSYSQEDWRERMNKLIHTPKYFGPNAFSIPELRDGKVVAGILPSELQKAYDVKWYFLNLEAENNTTDIKGNVTIKAQVSWPKLETFSFHLHNAYTIDSLKVDGIKQLCTNNQDERLVPNLHLLEGQVFDVQVFYHTTQPSGGSAFSGIKTAPPTFKFGNTTWTLSEPNNAYEWLPVKQDLTDKADSAWIFVTTADTNKVGSNGNLEAVVPLPNNKARYEWKTRYSIDYYLISMAISNYQDYSIYATIPQTQEKVLVQNFIYNKPNYLEENKKFIDQTAEMITYFSELFGPYPFRLEKYGHATAPIGGGMEHQTMTTIDFFSPFLVAHELAHQWFGNNVTCASWEYIWLNEGLASYSEWLWEEHQLGKKTAFEKFYSIEIFPTLYLAPSGSVYVPKESINNTSRIFNQTLTYSKGAILVHMLRYELNDDNQFFKVLQTYQERFASKAATLDDFKGIAEEISEKDFTPFFNQWFYGEGYPIFDLVYTHSDGQLIIESNQTASHAVKTPLFITPFEVQINYSDKTNKLVRFFQDANKCRFTYQYPSEKSIRSITFDPSRCLFAKANTRYNPTGIPENKLREQKIFVYPNPVDDVMNIRLDESLVGTKEIQLTNISGKIMLQRSVHVNELSLDASGFKSGIYHLRVSCSGQHYDQKVIKH